MSELGGTGRHVLLVSGLARESRIGRGPGVVTLCGNAARLAALLDAQSAANLKAVISFGIAGGLDPALEPGNLVLAVRVHYGSQTWTADPPLVSSLSQNFAAAGLATRHGAIAGVDAPVMTPAGKAEQRAVTGADAVDMESHLVAAYAAKHGLPFCALRVISDPATRALPAAASRAVKPDGRIDLAAVLKNMPRRPAHVGPMIAAARDAAAAFGALGRCRRLLGVAHL